MSVFHQKEQIPYYLAANIVACFFLIQGDDYQSADWRFDKVC